MAEQTNKPAPAPIVLKYIGNGAYFAGYPACDLTEADIAASGFSAEQLLALTIGVDTEETKAPRLFERAEAQAAPVAVEPPVANDPPAAASWGNDDEVTNG